MKKLRRGRGQKQLAAIRENRAFFSFHSPLFVAVLRRLARWTPRDK